MKLTSAVLISRYLKDGVSPKNGRGLTIQPFPYTGPPLSLKNKVISQGGKSKSAPCMFEITNLLACLKENDFQESQCFKQASDLKSCNEGVMASMKLKKQQEREGILIPKAKSFSNSQLNILLKKHPQPDVDR